MQTWHLTVSTTVPPPPLSGPSTTTETETVAKYEIMDGAPVKGNFDQ